MLCKHKIILISRVIQLYENKGKNYNKKNTKLALAKNCTSMTSAGEKKTKQNKTLYFVTHAQICQNCDTHIHHHHTNP